MIEDGESIFDPPSSILNCFASAYDFLAIAAGACCSMTLTTLPG